MRFRLLAVLGMLAILGGCTFGSSNFNGPVLDIDGDLLGRYWLVRQSESTFEAPPAQRQDCGDGYVLLRYVIDSRGELYEAEILESEPEGCYEDASIVLLQTWSFLPTPFNERRTPVRVTQRIPFIND